MAYSKFNRSDLKFEKQIGEGSYSTVYQAKCLGTDPVAVKKLYKVHDDELKIMSQLHHENIVSLLGVVDEEPDFYLILELCSGGSLRNFLDTYGFERLPKDLFFDWSKQAVKPIKYLKKHGIVHKDIKSANYVITSENILKLTDFGLSKKIEQTMSNATGRGTYGFMSPELMKSVILSTSYDIFSYGVVVWELWTTDVPFKGEPYYLIIWKVCNDNEHPPIPTDCPEPIANMMRQCWKVDWKVRPDVDELLAVIDEAKKAAKQLEQKICVKEQEGEQHDSLDIDTKGARSGNQCEGNGQVGLEKKIPQKGKTITDKDHFVFDGEYSSSKKLYEPFLIFSIDKVKIKKGLQFESISNSLSDACFIRGEAQEDFPHFPLITSQQISESQANQRKILHNSWTPTRQIGETGPDQLRGSRGITTTTTGDFAVAHKLSNRFVCVFSEKGIVKFNLDTNIHTVMSSRPEPWDVVISSDGIYYVTDRTPYVKMFSSRDGSCIGNWVTKSHQTNVYTTQMAQDSLVTISPAESSECGLHKSLTSNQINGMLKGLAINSNDQLYVGDIKHKYVSKHTKDGTHIMSFRVSITPRSLAVTSNETIVVSDWFETKSILLLNTSGQCLQVIKPKAILPEDWTPQGITCYRDVICVCNFADTKIYCFNDHGEYLGFMPLDTPQYPRCLAFSSDGNKLYVVFGHNPLPCHGIAIYEQQ